MFGLVSYFILFTVYLLVVIVYSNYDRKKKKNPLCNIKQKFINERLFFLLLALSNLTDMSKSFNFLVSLVGLDVIQS